MSIASPIEKAMPKLINAGFRAKALTDDAPVSVTVQPVEPLVIPQTLLPEDDAIVTLVKPPRRPETDETEDKTGDDDKTIIVTLEKPTVEGYEPPDSEPDGPMPSEEKMGFGL